MHLMNKKWLCVHEELAYKKIVNAQMDKVRHAWEIR